MKHLKIIILLALLLPFTFAKAQSDVKVQSVFVYNFTRLVSWPGDYQSGDFVIGVLGNSPIVAEFNDMAASKRAGNQNIVVKTFSNVEEISRCHILYVPSNQARRTSDVVMKVKSSGYKTLVVGDSGSGIKSGAVINFVVVDNRQRFELSQINAQAMGLMVGGDLQRLAILVD